jgi:hypothetical protein
MIDLTQSAFASPLIHMVPRDPGAPGALWSKDRDVVVNAPPDCAVAGGALPEPGKHWGDDGVRTGVCGVVSPRVVRLSDGAYRLYYTQIVPRAGHPAGANDYGNASTRILSAKSNDGLVWTPEAGVRLSAQEGGAGDFRVASSEVVPRMGGAGLRMYYECCAGTQSNANSIKSAVSEDGLTWRVEEGDRIADGGNYMAARIVFLEDGRCRMYCCRNGMGIVSAVSSDGLRFEMEPGVRIAQDGEYDRVAAFACDVLKIAGGGYVMYYAGYGAPNRAHILHATSEDGVNWRKSPGAVVAPGGKWDGVKCSEVSLYRLPENQAGERVCRMVYEACDGTAAGERGVWRIAGATKE